MPYGMLLPGALLVIFEQKQHVQLQPEPHGVHGHVALDGGMGHVLKLLPHGHVSDLDEVDNAQISVEDRSSTRTTFLY